MGGYTKLFSSIVASTIWREQKETKIVWITLLAMANASGRVDASVPGLADLSRVTLDECQAALAVLVAPDSWSRSPEFEGRRIEAVPGGWQILNYSKYRENRDPEIRREQNREAQARYRQRKQVSQSKPNVSRDKPQSAQAEAEAEAYHPNPAAPLPEEVIYQSYPRKVGRTEALKAIRACLKKLTLDQLLSRTVQYRDAVKLWNPQDLQFIPHPATWFNRGSYDDDPETWKRHAKPNPHQRANDRSFSQVDDYSKLPGQI